MCFGCGSIIPITKETAWSGIVNPRSSSASSTPSSPSPSVAFLVGALFLLGMELWGVSRSERGDTITENWRAANKYLSEHAPWFGWTFRVFTGGLLIWVLFHFLAGTD
jgi:hypothetical protein